MAKPGGAICNDCWLASILKRALERAIKLARMPDETLEQFIRQHIAAQSGDRIDFAAGRQTDHDGATVFPSGLSHYVKSTAMGEKNPAHALQTNGITVMTSGRAFR